MTTPKNEAKELANILSGMGEGGVPEDLWDRDDHADGDVYVARAAELLLEFSKPIDMVLHCPVCGEQHIDAPVACDMSVGCEEAGTCFAAAHGEPERCVAWDNPPHRSHLCHNCGHIWRPADVPTNGVEAVKTKGKDDKVYVPFYTGNMPTNRDERHLRRLLAQLAGIPHTYYDDGEAFAQVPQFGIVIDFMREPVANIDAKMRALDVARYESISSDRVVATDADSVRRELMALARRTVITDRDRVLIGAAIGLIGEDDHQHHPQPANP